MVETYEWNSVPQNEAMKAIRLRQNELKLNYINALRAFDKVQNFDGTLQHKVFQAKNILLAFEKTMPGNDGFVSTIDFDGSNRNHQ